MTYLEYNLGHPAPSLKSAWPIAKEALRDLATGPNFWAHLETAFGNDLDSQKAAALAAEWGAGDFSGLPEIEVRPGSEINGAMGAFSGDTNTIYFSQEFLSANAGNGEAVASVWLEEIGHFVDSVVNSEDAAGDEGDIFSRLVRGEVLNGLELLKGEDDGAVVVLDEDTIFIEQSNEIVEGKAKDEVLNGFSGNDVVRGKGGDDIVRGGTGNDTLEGGVGNDTLIGDAGTDWLVGGPGADLFFFRKDTAASDKSLADRIADFNPDEGDRIGLSEKLSEGRLDYEDGQSIRTIYENNDVLWLGVIENTTLDYWNYTNYLRDFTFVKTRDDSDWLSRLNFFRSMANLASVTENSAWTDGAVKHSRYLVKNNIISHDEDPNNPWYTPEGAEAGRSGNITSGTTSVSAIDSWMSAPFHGLQMIDPQLTQVAFGSYQETGSPRMIATLDVIRGREWSIPPSVNYPVMWPANGKTLPLTYFGSEWPDPLSGSGYNAPSGAPIYLQLGPGDVTPNVTASSFRQGNTPLEHIVLDETNYTNPNSNEQSLGRSVLDARDTIVIMPKDPLSWGETYTASITANGETYTWSFKVDINEATIFPTGTPDEGNRKKAGKDGDGKNNKLKGGTGDDTINGKGGNDRINGLGGNDTLIGGGGRDRINGGKGSDRLDGGKGKDQLIGGAGKDTLIGAGDNDFLKGDGSSDRLEGGTGKDRLNGGSGKDTLIGGGGNDRLTGDAGNDVLTGGGGKDRFIYESNRRFRTRDFGKDKIADFIIRQDDIVLDRTTFNSLESKAGNSLLANDFAVISGKASAARSSAEIVYNSSTGELFYNANGRAPGFGGGGKFATLTNEPALSRTDFIVQN